MTFRFEAISKCFHSANRLPASVGSEVNRPQLGQLSANHPYGQTLGGLFGCPFGDSNSPFFETFEGRSGHPDWGWNRGETAEIRCDRPNRQEPGPIRWPPKLEIGSVSRCLLE